MSELFDDQMELPSEDLNKMSEGLIGFSRRYEHIKKHLMIILSPEKLERWSVKFHKTKLSLCEMIQQRHPLMIFSGDVGTGKTVFAECLASRLTQEMHKAGFLLRLSTQVRGKGLHGEMSQLIQDSFKVLKDLAGKNRLAFLLIDEADSIASLRSTEQMHQEEKAAVNTLIQKLDEIRILKGRAVVLLCTNRAHSIDQAIVRRVAMHVEFKRPTKREALDLLSQDLEGIGLNEAQLDEIASLTTKGGHHGQIGYTFSDYRLRFLPEAIVRSFPDKPLGYETLIEVACDLKPSSEI